MTRAFRLTTPSIVSLADHFFRRRVARTKVHEVGWGWRGLPFDGYNFLGPDPSRYIKILRGLQKVRDAFAHPRGFLDFDSPEVDAVFKSIKHWPTSEDLRALFNERLEV